MNIEPTNEADVVCKDLIGEAYEAAYSKFPGGWFTGVNAVWDKVQKALKMDMSTTRGEDAEAQDILEEVFEEACQTAFVGGSVAPGSEYVDYQKLWERICAVIGVKV